MLGCDSISGKGAKFSPAGPTLPRQEVLINHPKRIGMITPSSNTALEPITSQITAAFQRDAFTIHYSRFVVKMISLEPNSLSQFTHGLMVDAARLLADGNMDVIAWNGTYGAWRGIADDRAMCDAITRATGAPATTSTLAQIDAFRALGVKSYGLAVPYADQIRQAIVETYGNAGFHCVRSAGLGISINTAFAEVDDTAIRDLIRQADHPDAEAIAIVCTNFPAAYVVDEMERELGKPIFDSVLVTLWQTLNLIDRPVSIRGWGRLLARDGKGPGK
jgi:maleate isomerase